MKTKASRSHPVTPVSPRALIKPVCHRDPAGIMSGSMAEPHLLAGKPVDVLHRSTGIQNNVLRTVVVDPNMPSSVVNFVMHAVGDQNGSSDPVIILYRKRLESGEFVFDIVAQKTILTMDKSGKLRTRQAKKATKCR